MNFTIDGGDIVVTVREAPKSIEGVAICGRNCRPGDDLCNNYCNKAPEKGPMAPRPADMTHHDCGATVSMRIPREDFERLIAPLSERKE